MLHVIAEIKVFFTIFAVGIIYFTLAILHMYYGCSTEGGCGLGTDFPKHFFYALSNVYFVMGGRYDPLINALQKEDLAAHIMIMIYFFFTVVLMINFLIESGKERRGKETNFNALFVVLINTAFGKGDERWRQVWVENRLRYVEAAENMSFVIEGFRCKHNWFPNEIYYTAVPAQIEQYRNKLLKKAYTNHGGSSSFANTNANDPISNSTLLSEVLKQNQFLHGFINQVRPFLYQPMAFPYYQPQPAQFPYPTQSQELDPLEDPIPKPTSGYAIYDPLGDSNVQGGPNEASGRRSPSIGTVGLHGPSYLPQTPRPTFQQAQYTTESEYLYDNVGMSPYHSLTPYNPTPYQPQPYPSTPYQSASYQPASYYPTSFQPTTFQPQSPLPTPPQPTTALPTPLYPISSLPTPILGSLQHNAALPQRPRPQSIVALQNQSPYQTPGQTAIPAVSSQTPYQRHQTLFQSIPTPHQSQQMPSPSSQIPSYARHQTLFQDIPTPVLQNILGQPTYGYPPPDYSASAYGGQIPYSPYSRIPSSAQSAQSAPTSYQPTSSQSAPSHYHPASAQSAPSQHYSASAQNAQTPYLGYQVAHQSPQVPQAVRRPQAFVQTPQQSPTSPALATPISQSDILNELSNREVGRSSLRNVHVLTRVDTDESESVEETERSGENNEDEEQDNKDSQGENGNEAIRSDTAVIDERLDEFGLPIPASGRE
ncbi:hypothetical protein BGZ76_010052 [Entomortierella beljakovae]|nr:hypothetical protein BGZ76_010052 [Entomortierella beljakovae]